MLAALKEYEALGASHLMFRINPGTPEAYTRLAEAVKRYRQ